MREAGLTLRSSEKNGVITEWLYANECRKDHPELGIHAYFGRQFRDLLSRDSTFLLGTVAVGLLEDAAGNLPPIPAGVELVETQIETYNGLYYGWQTQPYRRLAIRGQGRWIPADDLSQILIMDAICVLQGYLGPWPIDRLFAGEAKPEDDQIIPRLLAHCDFIMLTENDGWRLVRYSRSTQLDAQ